MSRQGPLAPRIEPTPAETSQHGHVPGSAGARPLGAVPRLLTLQELSQVLQLNPRTIRRMIAARRIPCVRLGRQLRFVPGDVFRWLEARKEG